MSLYQLPDLLVTCRCESALDAFLRRVGEQPQDEAALGADQVIRGLAGGGVGADDVGRHGSAAGHVDDSRRLQGAVFDHFDREAGELFDLADAEAVAHGFSQVHGFDSVLCLRSALGERAARL
jgi:hypothetical protein